MELWIRSQDKEMLAKMDRIDIDTDGRKILINGFETIVGEYATKERALEVLDEIQKMLDGRWIKENISNASMQNIFPIMLYEMPKD